MPNLNHVRGLFKITAASFEIACWCRPHLPQLTQHRTHTPSSITSELTARAHNGSGSGSVSASPSPSPSPTAYTHAHTVALAVALQPQPYILAAAAAAAAAAPFFALAPGTQFETHFKKRTSPFECRVRLTLVSNSSYLMMMLIPTQAQTPLSLS